MPARWFDQLQKLALDIREDLERGGKIALIGSDDGPHEVVPYRGYGNANRVLVQGRALESRGIGKSAETDGTIRNLINTYKRARSFPLRHARVHARVGGVERELVADDEGFFREWIELPEPLSTSDAWHEAELSLLGPLREGQTEAKSTAAIRIATDSAAFGVISDLDDTVIQSRVSNFLLAVRTVMLGNARTRLPFPGVAALYQALETGHDGQRKNPIYYVSSSPWNIYDLIAEFMDLQRIPEGPICLRDWDIDIDALTSSRLKTHKEPLIREILDLHPSLPFILIGDTSQQDPEIYHEISKSYPGRILAIYVRNVDPNPERLASVKALAEQVLAVGSTLILADDSGAAAKHAIEQGWIHPDSLPAIMQEKKADEGKTDAKAPAAGVGDEPPAPTIVVE